MSPVLPLYCYMKLLLEILRSRAARGRNAARAVGLEHAICTVIREHLCGCWAVRHSHAARSFAAQHFDRQQRSLSANSANQLGEKGCELLHQCPTLIALDWIPQVMNWPVWMAASDGSQVTCVAGTVAEDMEASWVNPLTFEQLWLPDGLALPAARLALGAVLKNGVPRYLFPCLETVVSSETSGIRVWHNRGLNSLPLGKTWLTFGDVPIDDMRISCYSQPLPNPDLEVGSDEAIDAAVRSERWDTLVPLTEVSEAMDALLGVIADGPDSLGQGFCYLIAPLASATLPTEALEPGKKLRSFLSDVDATPTSLDVAMRDEWVWSRGEMELSTHVTASGRDSDFLPEVYKPLFRS